MNTSLKTAALVLGASLAFGASAVDVKKHPLPKKQPQHYTCEDLLLTDFEYVPEVVYWHDGWNSKTKTLDETIVEDWEPVEVDEVWTECHKDPKAKVAEVVAAKRAHKNASKAGAKSPKAKASE